VTGWFVSGFNSPPVYYDYGSNVYYENNVVYYEGEPVGSSEEYAQQAQQIAAAVPEVVPEQAEWLPLGVFALTADDPSAEDATIFLQLAVSKEGIIAGTLRNTATDAAVEVEGTVDSESQRAAWGIVGEQWPIMETGVYNLTENDAGALLHFEDGQTQEWRLVRMDEPEESSR
jgi:hypothetical protein